jgi:hypothetical protein
VLLWIDLDSKTDDEKQAEQDKKMTWRSWFDGARGPIAKEWHVQGIPALYLRDGKGVIRYKWVGSPGGAVIDKAVEKPVKETGGGN